LISFRMDWFDLLAVQGTLKSLLQHRPICYYDCYCGYIYIQTESYTRGVALGAE